MNRFSNSINFPLQSFLIGLSECAVIHIRWTVALYDETYSFPLTHGTPPAID